MKKLEILSNVFCGFGMLFYAVFQLTKNSISWPSFFADNAEYIAFGSIGLGYLMTIIYYYLTKNAKKAKELLLVAIIITAVCMVFYLSAKL